MRAKLNADTITRDARAFVAFLDGEEFTVDNLNVIGERIWPPVKT